MMTGKRSLAQNEPVSGKTSRDGTEKKRRKLLHEDEPANPSQFPSPPPKQSGKRRKSKSLGSDLTPRKEADAELALRSSQDPSRAEELKAPPEEQQSLIHAKASDSKDWSVSRCAGGRFLNLDPVFAGDGRYLILATENEAQVFSMSTSRIVRTLPTPGSQRLTGYKVSPTNPERLFTSTSSGLIMQWNWESGAEIQAHQKPHPVIAIDIASSDNGLLVFALCETDDGHRQLSIDVPSDEENGEWKSTTILRTNTPLNDVIAVAGGRIVFAWAGDRLSVGHTTKPLAVSNLESTKYTWREVRLPVRATCLDVRVPQDSEEQLSTSHSAELPRVDVALGEAAGSILIYNDIIGRLKRSEKNGTDSNLVSSRLHWHRKPVKALRWSKDGNYIISGGLETVLVLWQLDTGRKQFLPHLSAPICNLVVSSQGTSYAIRLGDNSAMVLSTSELRPVASMSGLQLPRREDILARPAVDTKGNKPKHLADPSRLPAVLHPIKPDHLLLAVPSTQLLPSMETTPTASLLQAFDIRSGQHISRQALTRTNVSVLSSGPQGTELTTPDIKLVGISSDGDWLATVDEWNQYPEDNNVLRPNAETNSQGANREPFLKFWQWDEIHSEWQLVTRIDAPHVNSLRRSSAPVLDLAVRPENLGFATVGGDGVVRLWTPDTQRRADRNKDESKRRAVRSWQCSQTVDLEKEPLVSNNNKPAAAACLSFSADGSILAACWPGTSSQASRNLVHLIDPITGAIRHSRDDLFAGTPRGMGFLDRYLIILSDRLVIWDIVSDGIKSMLQFSGNQANSFLALNPRSQTFAVTHSNTRFTVFEPSSSHPMFETTLNNPARALLPDLRSGEYVVVDTAAQIMRAGSDQKLQPLALDREETDMAVSNGLENIFGSYAAPANPETAPGGLIEEAGASSADATRRTTTTNLADIFDVAPSFAMPAVDVLFKNVVDLFNRSAKA